MADRYEITLRVENDTCIRPFRLYVKVGARSFEYARQQAVAYAAKKYRVLKVLDWRKL
jgi:hypothetical protein